MGEQRRQARQLRRKRRRLQRRVHTSRHIHRILRILVLPAMARLFNVRGENTAVIRNTPKPYLIMGNHASVLDPFFVHSFVHTPIHYVVSDSNFRTRLVGFFLNLIGSIPKTKAVSDLETVKHIVELKRQKAIIGIFPEGQSSWDGHTLPFVRATAKLIKSLKVPVVTANIRGAYLTSPRWARNARKGRVVIRFHRTFAPEELKDLSVSDVEERLQKALEHDEFAYQQKARVRYFGTRLAEYLERTLFVCPQCRSLNTLRSRRRRFTCHDCGYAVAFNPYGFFEPRNGPLVFRTVRDWNLWQLNEFNARVAQSIANAHRDPDELNRPVMTEDGVTLHQGYKSLPLELMGTGTVKLFPDRVAFDLNNGESFDFPIERLTGTNIQNNERWEFYCDDVLYRMSTVDPRGNTYKWDAAVKFLQQHGSVASSSQTPTA